MISAQMKNTYTEVYVILKKLNLISKLPDTIIDLLLQEKNSKHSFDFNLEDPLYEQIENVDTISLISYLYVKYLCEDSEEKQWLISKYKENEVKHQQNLQEKYDVENIFKSRISESVQQAPIIVHKERNIFQRFFDRFISFFKKKKNYRS